MKTNKNRLFWRLFFSFLGAVATGGIIYFIEAINLTVHIILSILFFVCLGTMGWTIGEMTEDD